MKITRNSLKELIRQSIKEIDFEDEEAFKKYQSQHKMRPTTKVNIAGKDTTVGQASDEEGGKEDDYDSDSPSAEDLAYDVEQAEEAWEDEELPDTDNLWDWHEQLSNETKVTGGKNNISNREIKVIEDYIAKYDDAMMGGDEEEAADYIQRIRSFNNNRRGIDVRESVRESVKPRRFTVKEVQKWMKTLEENRYKKVYNSDCRRVAWMVNNIGENVVNMPKSMRKKWTKAAYGRERYLAREFVKAKTGEQKLKETIRKIAARLIND